jgi:glutathione S-transferase
MLGRMRARLYVTPASHPCVAVEKALQLKGLPYDRVDLLPAVHKVVQRLRFGQATVPGLQLDGERIIGSSRIYRRLDALEPSPALLPDARVEEAERWGDEVLQGIPRRLLWTLLARDTTPMRSYADGAKLPIPIDLALASAPIVARLARGYNHGGDGVARVDLQALPGHLDHVDALLAEGVIGGDTPNAADLQILSSVALLATVRDLDRLLERRPSLDAARALFPDFPGETPAGAVPPGWLPAAVA